MTPVRFSDGGRSAVAGKQTMEYAYRVIAAKRQIGVYLAGARMLNVKCEMQNEVFLSEMIKAPPQSEHRKFALCIMCLSVLLSKLCVC